MEDHKVLEIDSLVAEEKSRKSSDSPNIRADRSDPKRDVWQSCCLQTDRHAVAYFGQLSISMVILAFSFIMLIAADGECNKSSPYIGLISFLMGKLLSSVVGSGS